MEENGSERNPFMLGVSPTQDVRLLQAGGGVKTADLQFIIQADGSETILSGMPVYLKAVGCGKMVEIVGDAVSARTKDCGTLQRIVMEKLPDGATPVACPEQELSLEEKAWLFR